jgi:hypothetical protein
LHTASPCPNSACYATRAVRPKILGQDHQLRSTSGSHVHRPHGASVLPCHVLCHISGLRQEHQHRKRSLHGVSGSRGNVGCFSLTPGAVRNTLLCAHIIGLCVKINQAGIDDLEIFCKPNRTMPSDHQSVTLSASLQKQTHQLAVNAIMPYTVLPHSSR